MRITSRLKILELIRKYQAVSVKELSTYTGLTGANIRHHLMMLEANELIEVVGHANLGKGRPHLIYGLSRKSLGDGLDHLSNALMQIMLSGLDEKQREELMGSVALQLSSPLEANVPMGLKVKHTVELMCRMHYRARWEAGISGPKVVLEHCPYRPIIQTNPWLCSMDVRFLELELGMEVKQLAQFHTSDRGLQYCSFQVYE